MVAHQHYTMQPQWSSPSSACTPEIHVQCFSFSSFCANMCRPESSMLQVPDADNFYGFGKILSCFYNFIFTWIFYPHLLHASLTERTHEIPECLFML